VGNGSTVLFWSDIWNDHLLQHKFPTLYSYAKNKDISVAQFLSQNNIADHFHLPMSVQAFQEYQQLQGTIQQLQISEENKDVWEYIWGGQQYTTSEFYNLASKHIQQPKAFIWIWDSRCSNKLDTGSISRLPHWCVQGRVQGKAISKKRTQRVGRPAIT
jgi:hypothetical protein